MRCFLPPEPHDPAMQHRGSKPSAGWALGLGLLLASCEQTRAGVEQDTREITESARETAEGVKQSLDDEMQTFKTETNAKLRDRSERIVMEVLGVAREDARTALDAAGGSVRTAIVMLHGNVDRSTAEQDLERVDHRLRRLIGPPPPVEPS